MHANVSSALADGAGPLEDEVSPLTDEASPLRVKPFPHANEASSVGFIFYSNCIFLSKEQK